MRGPWRAILGVLAGFVVMAAAAWPLRRAELLLRRETLRAMEAAGIMDTDRGLGGQIMGYNYFRHPEWAHWVAGIASAAVAFAPGVLPGLLVMRRIGGLGQRGVTRCGACRKVLRNLTEPRCPHCGEGL